jgi:hypothetical protein
VINRCRFFFQPRSAEIGTDANHRAFIGTAPAGGAPTFGPSGSILIDPAFGGDDQVDVFGNYRVTVMS